MNEKEIEYPYYKMIYTLNKNNIQNIIKNFKPIILTNIPTELKKYNISKYSNKEYIIIKDKWITNYELNNLTDYFSENVRITCKFGNNISPLEYWKEHKKQILEKTNDIRVMREIIYKNTKLCNNFRISLALTILQIFKPKRWLDISAGWGDRLIAGILFKIKLYYSTDPNKDLHPCYKKIIDTFVSSNNKKNFIIKDNGFETDEFIIPYNNFDIVFSSPPFFKLEKYSSYNNDSITKYNEEKDWTEEFLIKSIYKAIKHLKDGGYLLLYMGGSEYVMNKLLSISSNQLHYKGIIYYYDDKPRAIYVWKKSF